MDMVHLIISLISGAVGGNLAGPAVSQKSMGAIGNTIAGLLGGGLGDFILKALGILATTSIAGTAPTGSEFDLTTLLANIGVSGVSGGALAAIANLIKDTMQKR